MGDRNASGALGRLCAMTLAVAAVFAGTAAVAAEPTTVRIGIAQASSDAPFFIADKKGYFAQEGIKAEFTPLTNMIPLLATGELDVGGVSTSAGLFNSAVRKLNIKVVADKGSTPPGYDYQPILVRKDLVDSGKVKDWKDFKGLRVAGFSKGSASESTLNEALSRGGLKISDINLIYMPFPEHVLALRNGAIDASITTEPSATAAIGSGAAVRFSGEAGVYPDHQLAVLLYGGDFIKKGDVGHRFMRAYIRAARDYNDALKDGKLAGPKAEEVIAILTEATVIKDPAVYRRITPNGIHPDGRVNIESMRKDLAFFKAQNLIEGNVSAEDVVDHSYVEEAAKVLGPYVRSGS